LLRLARAWLDFEQFGADLNDDNIRIINGQ
jgi:hypothetical protein